jgi:23S rRNA (adenine-N6)-dimethyltransferase
MHAVHPHISYSQNVLRSRSLAEGLIACSSITPNDVVLEIGPGGGIITAALAARCRRVLAVERDPRLASSLRDRFGGDPRVTIHAGDFLRFPLPAGPYKVFANIPFFATAAIVAKLTSGVSPPDDSYLVVQREAAARYLGEPVETLVALLLKPRFEPTVEHRFDRRDFAPVPGVETVLLRLRKRAPSLLTSSEEDAYRDLVAHAFTVWRPTLYDALRPLCGARRCEYLWRTLRLPRAVTPARLSFEQWLAIFRQLASADIVALWRTVAGAEHRLRLQQANLQKIHRTRSPARRLERRSP